MILVTVGTTPFDGLIREVDHSFPTGWDVHLQIAAGEYIPTRFPWFRFSDHIDDLYKRADIIVCHAGAGTVLRLMELRKKIIVIPNLVRSDQHQMELAEFLDTNRHAIVCYRPSDILNGIETVHQYDFAPYEKQRFIGAELLLKKIQELYSA